MLRCGAKYRIRTICTRKKLETAKKTKTKKCVQDQEMRRSSGKAGRGVEGEGEVCRRKRSSSFFFRFFGWRSSWPAAHQRSGDQRQEQFVMASDGVAARLLSFAATRGSCGAPHYILQRTIVLNKVEVGGGDGAKRNAKITHDGDGFQENLRK